MERIYIPKTVKGKEYIQRLAVQQNGLAIQYIPCPSQELCLIACEQNGLAIQFIDNPTDEMWEAAVNQNGMAIQFMNFVSDINEFVSESETEEYTTPIFTDEPELEYPKLSDINEVANFLAKGGRLVDHLGKPIEGGTIYEMIDKATEQLWNFPENGPQVKNVLPNETNFAYKKPDWDLFNEECIPLVQKDTPTWFREKFPDNIKDPVRTSVHTCYSIDDSDVYNFPTFVPTFNFSEYGPLAGNSVIDGEPQFAYNPELPPVNYESPFDMPGIAGICEKCRDVVITIPYVMCDNLCNTVTCICGDEYYHKSDGTHKGSFLVKGHDPKCGKDSDDDIPELESDSDTSSGSFASI